MKDLARDIVGPSPKSDGRAGPTDRLTTLAGFLSWPWVLPPGGGAPRAYGSPRNPGRLACRPWVLPAASTAGAGLRIAAPFRHTCPTAAGGPSGMRGSFPNAVADRPRLRTPPSVRFRARTGGHPICRPAATQKPLGPVNVLACKFLMGGRGRRSSDRRPPATATVRPTDGWPKLGNRRGRLKLLAVRKRPRTFHPSRAAGIFQKIFRPVASRRHKGVGSPAKSTFRPESQATFARVSGGFSKNPLAIWRPIREGGPLLGRRE